MSCKNFLGGVIVGLAIGGVVGFLLWQRTSAADGDEKGDLTKIEGIGPKIAGLLAVNGIGSFSRLAKSRLEDLQRILKAGGPHFRLADPATWAEQAKLAAVSDWAGLRDLQGQLRGGRKV
ncbi:MAG TPA: helix-hairpin-helix domain-containing protein [Syntrophales bacterium]